MQPLLRPKVIALSVMKAEPQGEQRWEVGGLSLLVSGVGGGTHTSDAPSRGAIQSQSYP